MNYLKIYLSIELTKLLIFFNQNAVILLIFIQSEYQYIFLILNLFNF